MWPFKRSKPAPPPQPRDFREWNEDWQVGDIAECVAKPGEWSDRWKPWQILAHGSRWEVAGFCEMRDIDGDMHYWLKLQGAPSPAYYQTTTFRKVRPIAQEQSETARRILDAPVGPEIERKAPVRETTQ